MNTEEASLQTLVDRDINRKENGFVIKYGTACINWDQNPLYSFFLFFFWSKQNCYWVIESALIKLELGIAWLFLNIKNLILILRVFYVKVENIYRLSKSDFGKEKYLYITMNGIRVSM